MLIPADCWQLGTDDRTLGMFDSNDGNWPNTEARSEYSCQIKSRFLQMNQGVW